MSKVAVHPPRPKGPRERLLLAVSALALGALVAFAWPSPDPKTVWESARKAFEARDFAGAQVELDRLSKLRAPTPLDWLLRAQVAMGQSRNEEAIENLARVPDDHPMAPQAQLQLGQLELRRNRFVPAEAAFLKALALDPKLIQARRELVYIYGTQLRRPELNATFKALSEVSALSFPEVFLWCLSRGVTWEPQEIAATLARCIEADPADRWGRLGRSDGLRDLSQLDEAEAVLTPLPETDPDARAARVRIALDRGDPSAAEALLDAGPADHLGLALLRGRLALARNDAPGAVRQFRIAHDKAPNIREAILGLGQALQMAGDSAAATPLLEEARKHELLGSLVQRAAVEANRTDPALIRDLGEACAAVGRIPEARAWYNLAISQDPLDTRAQQGLARLQDPAEPSSPR